MKIYIMNGQCCVGKDTLQQMIREEVPDGVLVAKISMVDFAKQFAENYLDWNGEKTPEARKMLSDLKDLLDNWMDASYKDVKETLKLLEEDGFDIVFIDAREPADIKRLVNDFSAETILIKRGETKDYGNHADNNVFNYEYDYIIENNGTLDDLRKTAKNFIKEHLTFN